MNNKIPLLSVVFRNQISDNEVPLLRGCILNIMKGCPDNLYYHNHQENNFRYAYPLVQYKTIHHQATMICLDKSVNDCGYLFQSLPCPISLGRRNILLEAAQITPVYFSLDVSEAPISYQLKRWLPFNAENYRRYQSIALLSERIGFLEKILTGNLLSLAKGLDVHIDFPLQCHILDLKATEMQKSKGVYMMAFTLTFQCNLLLPDYLGIGKHSSIGFGIITHINEPKSKPQNNE